MCSDGEFDCWMEQGTHNICMWILSSKMNTSLSKGYILNFVLKNALYVT